MTIKYFKKWENGISSGEHECTEEQAKFIEEFVETHVFSVNYFETASKDAILERKASDKPLDISQFVYSGNLGKIAFYDYERIRFNLDEDINVCKVIGEDYTSYGTYGIRECVGSIYGGIKKVK